MIRSMSYSRYLRTATPMAIGISERPTGKTSGPNTGPTRSATPRKRTSSATTTKVNHLSCWRSSPRARRNRTTTEASAARSRAGAAMPAMVWIGPQQPFGRFQPEGVVGVVGEAEIDWSGGEQKRGQIQAQHQPDG